ncbi:MAG: ArsR/SmtB family transcription factor [Acidobacteriota bacterium]|jgi:ArsR family transcriptional regulator|nr:metalloregulator ArsR/SmtB family transcription factor [Bryobacteraceae bacterium CoA2 C42]
MPNPDDAELITRHADRLAALGAEPRLRIVRLLLSAHPHGLIAGDLGAELAIPPSTLSHHLEKLKNEDLVKVRREGTFLWYSANTTALQDLLAFLYAECCTRSKAIEPRQILCCPELP